MDSSDPWYQCEGPDANYVRNDIFKKIKEAETSENEISDESLNTILCDNIPDSKKDFGSWRGYCTFGLDDKILNKIHDDIKNARNT